MKFGSSVAGHRQAERVPGWRTVVSLGKPFQSAISLLNGDWFVPYRSSCPGKKCSFVTATIIPPSDTLSMHVLRRDRPDTKKLCGSAVKSSRQREI